jgi:uncharacterized OsmC-like protein
MTSTVLYEGNLRTVCTHLQSGNQIETDAPTDNQGKGERFSPTDLIATAFASCILTTMAIRAKDLESKIRQSSITTEKIMSANPRRISAINLTFQFAENVFFSPEQQQILEQIALTCPVKECLHPEMQLNIDFNWPQKS